MKIEKPKAKFFFKLLLILILIIAGYYMFYFLTPKIKQAYQYNKGAQQLVKEINKKNKEYSKDLYGASTPEKTYQLFLQALQDENIDLAVKYFVPEKQNLYRQLFLEIKKNNQWAAMLSDLLKKKNQEGTYRDKNTYIIHVLNANNVLIAQPVLRQMVNYNSNRNSAFKIWKLVEF